MSPTEQRRRGSGQDHRDGAERHRDYTAAATARQCVAIAPIIVSDRTCDATLGVPWRALRAWCAARKIPITRIGRRSVVCVDAVLDAMQGSPPEPSAPAWDAAAVVRAAARRGGR